MSINFLDPVTNYGTVQSRVNANFAALKAYTNEKAASARTTAVSQANAYTDEQVQQLTGLDPTVIADFQAVLNDYQAGQDATDTAVASVVRADGQTRAVLDDTYATRRLGLAGAPTAVGVSTRGSTPEPIEVFGGYVWGYYGGNIHRSGDGGTTWETYCPSPVGDAVLRLLPTDDGEVIAVRGEAVYKSTGWATGSPTWVTKVTANGQARFTSFQADGDGTKFIVAQYGPSSSPGSQSWIDSRYAHISTDGGDTWVQAWDSVAQHGQAVSDTSHLHGVCYDPWSDRFYLAEGHGTGSGIYVSTDNGVTWTRPPGLVNTPPPTVLVATDDGIVCGSDHALAGIWGIVRQSDPSRETIVRTWAWNVGVDGVIGFGTRGFRDPTTGVVYIGFRTASANVAPIIAGGTGASAGLVWTWPTLPVTLADAVTQLVVNDGELLASATVNGTNYLLRGTLAAPASSTVVDRGNVLSGQAGGSSVAVGPGASVGSGGLRHVVVGQGVTTPASTNDITAVGNGAAPQGTGATVIGRSATSAPNAVAVGRTANAGGQSAVVGDAATTNSGTQAVAFGTNASARTQSVVVGYNASVPAANSQAVAVGAGANSAQSSLAAGFQAAATGFKSIALGSGATASHSGAVALGADVVTTASSQVAMGAKHIELGELAGPPANPGADKVRLYISDNGSGKTQLVARFASGPIVLATEP